MQVAVTLWWRVPPWGPGREGPGQGLPLIPSSPCLDALSSVMSLLAELPGCLYFLGQKEVTGSDEVTLSQPFLVSAPGAHGDWKEAVRGGPAGPGGRAAAEPALSFPTALPDGHVSADGALWASHDFLDLGFFVC